MNLVEAQVVPVIYTSTSNEVSSRVILPTYVPGDNVKAIDLTDSTDRERSELIEAFNEYRDYKQQLLNSLMTFEKWLDYQGYDHVQPKWRTFKVSGLK